MKDRLAKLDPVRRLIVERAAEVGTDLKALSAQLGKNVSYLHSFVTKGTPRKLDGDDRARLAELLELPEASLKDGQAHRAQVPSIETVKGVEYARLPMHDIRASAGAGIPVEDSEPTGWRLFDHNWLKSVTLSKLPALRVIQVAGDSMLDTLSNGDHVLVDLNQRSLARDTVFVHGIFAGDRQLKFSPRRGSRQRKHIDGGALARKNTPLGGRPRPARRERL